MHTTPELDRQPARVMQMNMSLFAEPKRRNVSR